MTAASTDTIGLGRRVNYALSLDLWPAQYISRATLRALLPPGDHRPDGTNRTQSALKQHLALCEARGFIKRGRVLVAVLEPQRLLENAVRGLAEVRCRDFLLLERATEVIEDQLASEEMPAGLRQRRAAELDIIKNMAQT
jgi:hypothetical protein